MRIRPSTATRLLTLLLPLAAGVALIIVLLGFQRWSLPEERIELVQGRFLVGGAAVARPEEGDPRWQPVQLPHDWRDIRPGVAVGWYELALEMPERPGQTWALFVPQAQMTVAAWLNGTPIGVGGSMESPVSRNFNRPRLLPVPGELLHPGRNSLLLQIATEPVGNGGLGRVYAAPLSALPLAHTWQYRLQVAAPKMVVVLMWAMSLPLLALWLRQTRDKAYGWFAATALAWSQANLDFCVIDPLLAARWWDWFLFSCIGWMSCAYPNFVLRFTGQSRPRLQRALGAYALGYPLLLALLPSHEAMYFAATHVFNNLHGLMAAYCCLQLYRSWLRHGDGNARLMLVFSLFGFAFAMHDALVLGPIWIGHYSRFLYVGAPFLIGAFVWGMLGRYMQALDQTESLNREMEGRIREKTRQLQASYDQLRHMEIERMLLAERTRIMRDMHDGVGGQLVATLCAVELGTSDLEQVKDDLRAALNDLRLVIDSLDPDEVSLHEVLYSFRGRMSSTLERAGLWVDWDIHELPTNFIVGPHKTLQIIRVLQEAVANVLKHAGAVHMRISCQVETDAEGRRCLLVEVDDDGLGYPADVRKGRGLPNMRRRAESIGARFVADSGKQGSRVLLILPEHAVPVLVPDPLAPG
ncbi:MAG TPA: ATP-binding protein [Solimonas sp.]|nr:ATP-binding protein [Solimonas sp.]